MNRSGAAKRRKSAQVARDAERQIAALEERAERSRRAWAALEASSVAMQTPAPVVVLPLWRRLVNWWEGRSGVSE